MTVKLHKKTVFYPIFFCIWFVLVFVGAYYFFPYGRSCVLLYVRSGSKTGTVYSIPEKGAFATHVEPSGSGPLEGIPVVGKVEGCRFESDRYFLDGINTSYCHVVRLLESNALTKRSRL